MRAAAAFLSGLVFGLGLVISQMANPAKVLNFLDLAGAWDPSLLVVMAAAVPVAGLGFWIARRRARPLLAESFQLPAPARPDARLAAGAVIFGIGWGLVGFCPGPALVALGLGRSEPFLFAMAMIAGMLLFDIFAAKRRRAASLAST